jgi:hypothetical protein
MGVALLLNAIEDEHPNVMFSTTCRLLYPFLFPFCHGVNGG